MRERSQFGTTIMAGVEVTLPIAVRETYWGYIIRSEAPDTPLGALSPRLSRLARLVCWVAVAGLWLVPMGPFSAEIFAFKGLASLVLLTVTYLGVSFLGRTQGYEFQVDTDRREVRTAVLSGGGGARITARATFDEIDDMELRSPPETVEPVLLVRLAEDAGRLCVAQGCADALVSIRDRLARDLVPLEMRMAGLVHDDAPRRAQPARWVSSEASEAVA